MKLKKYTNDKDKKRKAVKSTVEGKVVNGKRVVVARTRPMTSTHSTAYVTETNRRRANDASRKYNAKERNRLARLYGGHGKAASAGAISRKR